MRVLIVSAWEPFSGVRTAYRTLAQHLGPQGISFDAYAFDGWSADSPWSEFCGRLLAPTDGTLTEVLVRSHYDVVHAIDTAYSPPYGVDVWLRRARYAGGVVLMSQNSHPALTETPRYPDVYISCSGASRDNMAQTVRQPIRVIENAVDRDVFYPGGGKAADGPVLLWVGRSSDDWQKAVSGFLFIAGHFSSYRIIVADLDEGADRLELELWLGERAAYCHRLSPSQLRDVYADVAASGGAVISTSRFEGLPFALVEAAACGTPVIAPRVPGMEYLTDGETALLYERSDGLSGVAGALRRLADPMVRERISRGGLGLVAERFSAQTMSASYLEAYQDAIAAASQTSRRISDQPARLFWRTALRARRLAHSRRGRSASPRRRQ